MLLLLVFLLEATIAVLFFAYSDKVCCCKWKVHGVLRDSVQKGPEPQGSVLWLWLYGWDSITLNS